MVGKHGLMPHSRSVRANQFAQATAADATYNIPAGHGLLGVALSGIEWSYSDDPTNGRLVVAVNGQDVINFDITSGGPGFQDYDPAIRFDGGQAVQLRLLNGGAGIVGKIRPKAWWYE